MSSRAGPTISEENEHELIAVAQRDRRGFAELYDRHFDHLYFFALARTGAADEAEDVTAQTLHHAFRSLNRFAPGTASFSDWLIEIATRALAERGKAARVIGASAVAHDPADPSFKRWLKEALMAMVPATHSLGPVARIGVLADTHCRQPDGADLPAQVLDAFAGVNLIVHCGDIGNIGLLDRLETIAPVLAVKGEADVGVTDARVSPTPRIVEAGGMRLGVVFDLGALSEANEFPAGPVDAIACGATHRDLVASQAGVLVVNPGSPTFPSAPKEGEGGTVAVLEMRPGVVTVEMVRLKRET